MVAVIIVYDRSAMDDLIGYEPSAVAIVANIMQPNSTANQKCGVIILHNKHVFNITSVPAYGYNLHTYLIIIIIL